MCLQFAIVVDCPLYYMLCVFKQLYLYIYICIYKYIVFQRSFPTTYQQTVSHNTFCYVINIQESDQKLDEIWYAGWEGNAEPDVQELGSAGATWMWWTKDSPPFTTRHRYPQHPQSWGRSQLLGGIEAGWSKSILYTAWLVSNKFLVEIVCPFWLCTVIQVTNLKWFINS